MWNILFLIALIGFVHGNPDTSDFCETISNTIEVYREKMEEVCTKGTGYNEEMCKNVNLMLGHLKDDHSNYCASIVPVKLDGDTIKYITNTGFLLAVITAVILYNFYNKENSGKHKKHKRVSIIDSSSEAST